MTPEKVLSTARILAFNWYEDDESLSVLADRIRDAIISACAEQREEDARLMEKMSGQISELTQEFDSSRAEGAFNALVNAAAAIRGAE